MLKPHWYLQENIHKKDLNSLIETILEQDMTYETFYHIAFDNVYPLLNINRPLFVYAASIVTDKIFNDHEQFAGVFATSSGINIQDLFLNNLEAMWSEPIYFGSLADYYQRTDQPDEFFIRPLLDDKSFAGEIMTSLEFNKWIDKLEDTVIDIHTTQVMVAPINYPTHEYRLCMVDGQFVTGSLYKNYMNAQMDTYIPHEVINLAEEFAKNNILPEAYIIDVGQSESRLGIIEVNSINNSGFYLLDKEKYVASISQLLIRKFNNMKINKKTI